MDLKKNNAFLSFLSESGVSDLQDERFSAFRPKGKKAEKDEGFSNFQTLDQVREALNAFESCGLKKYAKNLVLGEGVSEKPLVMCIGEAPGADEDVLGRPFVGRAGQLLDKMLGSIGLSREKNTYITNVIPWRPPGNRTPTLEEITLCRPFVLNQIEIVKPKVILLLGGSPTQALTDRTDGITRLRGQSFTISGLPALATFHPAYLLRSPEKKKETWMDLLSLKKCLFT